MIALNRIIPALCCTVLFSCQKSDTSYKLSGRFSNTTCLEQSTTRLLRAIPFYAVEMTFGKDSVLFSNGFETGQLAYTRNGNRYTLKNAYQHNGTLKDMTLEATSDSTFVLADKEYTRSASPSVFTKSDVPFETKLARTLIDGHYKILYPEALKATPVTFSGNRIIGLPGYQSYTLCYSGDCMQLVDEATNILMLTQTDGTTTLFGWHYGPGNTIGLDSVSAPLPDSKGGQHLTGSAYLLKKTGK